MLNLLRKHGTVFSMMLVSTLVLAHSENSPGQWERSREHYSIAIKAYKDGDHVTCLEQFAAFQAIAYDYLALNPELAKGVNQRIKYCRDRLENQRHFEVSTLNPIPRKKVIVRRPVR